MLNIVIPMAGEGSRFKNAGFHTPKPFIKFAGKMMIEWVIDNLKPEWKHRFIFLVREEHLGSYYGQKFAEQGHLIVPVRELTQGTACTLLLAKHLIDNDDELIIANSDQFIEFDINDFIVESRKYDGNIAVFRANDSKWSYAKVENNRVIQVAEKQPISDNATCGVYYWKKGSDFVRSAKTMIEANDRFNNEFYTCPTYNYFVKDNYVSAYSVKKMWGLGTPPDLLTFINKYVLKD
jgi:NDP-sugar pyrophosphorylase family protein